MTSDPSAGHRDRTALLTAALRARSRSVPAVAPDAVRAVLRSAATWSPAEAADLEALGWAESGLLNDAGTFARDALAAPGWRLDVRRVGADGGRRWTALAGPRACLLVVPLADGTVRAELRPAPELVGLALTWWGAARRPHLGGDPVRVRIDALDGAVAAGSDAGMPWQGPAVLAVATARHPDGGAEPPPAMSAVVSADGIRAARQDGEEAELTPVPPRALWSSLLSMLITVDRARGTGAGQR